MNRRIRITLLSSLFALLLSQGAFSAVSDDPKPLLDEVTIKGKRTQLRETRQEFNKVQDRLFARYNELNGNSKFDMACRDIMKTGTRIGGKRECTAVFEDDAYQLEAQMTFEHMQPIQEQLAAGKEPISMNSTPAPAAMAIEARRPEFRANWRKVASSDPELIRLLRQRSELRERYETLRREIFGLPPMPAKKDAAASPAR